MTGSKNWSAGDVLNAADVNSILANQVVMVFADSSARDAGFGGSGEPTLAEGMFCHLNDTNEFQVYSGSAWTTIGDHEVLIIDSANARVGINTATPYESLDMTHLNNLGVGTEITYGTHSNTVFTGYINFHGYQGAATQYRNLGIYNGRQGQLMFFTGSSGLVHCTNEFTAGTKTFDIPHPIKGGDWRLRHASVEGPRHDLIYRGTVTLTGGTATVDLDEASGMTAGTWEALCRDPWTMAASSGNAVEWVLDGSTLTITSSTADAVCNWMVMAERHDAQVKGENAPSAHDDGHLVTEYERDDPEPNMPTE